MKFKCRLDSSSVSTQGILGCIFTDIIWDTGKDRDKEIVSDDFAKFYKSDNVLIEWEVRFDDKGSGFYMDIVVDKISGVHICEYLMKTEDDEEVDFEFTDDGWEIKSEAFYDPKNYGLNLASAVFPKGLEIDYGVKECVVYFGK